MVVTIQETFEKLQEFNMKLNPGKCSFGVEERPFLGHLIMRKGIKANPSKLISFKRSRQDPSLLENTKELHEQENSLMDNRGRRGIPKNEGAHIEITNGYSLNKGKALVMYLAASEESISAVLLAERGKKHVPIYFISRTLQGAKLEPENSGRIAKWEIELGEHDIKFRGRNSVKGHILADFLAKTPLVENIEMKSNKTTNEEPELENT
ncbi:hypothetical protein Tco_1099480 [Tanacetum coccineum]